MAYMPIGPKTKAAAVPVTLATDEGLAAAIGDDLRGGAGIPVSGITIASQYEEDSQHVSADTGTMVLAVRKDAAGTLAAHDNDYAPVQVDANGALRVTGGGGGTEYTEDVAAAADPAGGMLIARRRDTPGAETTTDGDNVALNATNKGELYVKQIDAVPAIVAGDVAHDSADSGSPVKIGGKANAAAPAAVTEGDRVNASFDLQGQLRVAGVTSTQYTEDAAAATDPVGTVPIMVRQDTLAVGTVTADGDNIAQRATAYGQAHVKALDTDALIGVATDAPVTDAEGATARSLVSLLKGSKNYLRTLAAGIAGDVAHDSADSGSPVKIGGKANAAAPGAVTEGDRVDASFDLTGQQRVVLASVPSHAVTNAGTFAVQAVAAGDVAHDAADSGNPVKIGGKGTAAAPAAVTEGDRVQASFDLTGALRTVVTEFPDITVDSEITTKDMDSGGGTDNQAVVGLVAAASGGAVLIPGDATNGLKVQALLLAGTAEIGKLAAGTAEIGKLAAGTALIGKVAAGDDSSTIYNGTTALTPKFVKISTTDTGDNTVLALVADKKIRVLSYTIVSAGTVSCTWMSDVVGGTQVALTGAMPLVANTGVHAAYCPVGHFETVSAKALVLTKSADVDVFGHLTYVEV